MEQNIFGYIKLATRGKTFITLVRVGITQKQAFMGPEFQLVRVIRSQKRETSIAKHLQKLVVMSNVKQKSVGNLELNS